MPFLHILVYLIEIHIVIQKIEPFFGTNKQIIEQAFLHFKGFYAIRGAMNSGIRWEIL